VPKRVLIAPQAEAQIRAIDAWWRRHRKRSPDLFSREFGEALSTLEVAPKAGRRYPHPAIKGLRRIPLRATRHHVYYLAGKDAVIVLAVWGSMKGAGPNLEGIE
jgi:plasmid stabilization system protein ParE